MEGAREEEDVENQPRVVDNQVLYNVNLVHLTKKGQTSTLRLAGNPVQYSGWCSSCFHHCELQSQNLLFPGCLNCQNYNSCNVSYKGHTVKIFERNIDSVQVETRWKRDEFNVFLK